MWRKSSYSGYNGNCVEVTQTPDLVLVRDSKDPAGPVLEFSTPQWREFVARLMAGEPGRCNSEIDPDSQPPQLR